jgi:hypothetical protein
MSTPKPSQDLDSRTDRLLRETLPDDLPAEIEARLTGRLQAFVLSQRRSRPDGHPLLLRASRLSALGRWPYARAALALAATLLLASGLGLQAAAAPGAADQPLRRINFSVTLFRSLRGASSLRCTGLSDSALGSPAALADAVYRRWVPVGTRTGPPGTLVATYRSTDPAAVYELVLEDATLLPLRVLRRAESAPTGQATCTWSAPAASDGGEPR